MIGDLIKERIRWGRPSKRKLPKPPTKSMKSKKIPELLENLKEKMSTQKRNAIRIRLAELGTYTTATACTVPRNA